MKNDFSTIILGLGAMGSAAAYQLAKRGNRVLGLAQFSPPHIYGSTHGDTRIIRQAIGEGEQYTPLALRAYEIWREIEKETKASLLNTVGGLIISIADGALTNNAKVLFEQTVKSAKQFKVMHEILNADQLRHTFPQFKVQANEVGYYEPGAGFLRPEQCVATQLALAEKYGAVLHKNELVESFIMENGRVRVKTNCTEYTSEKLIISAGAWLPTLLEKKYGPVFTIRRQVLYWFDIKSNAPNFLPDKCPIFIWETPGNKLDIYGFPAIDGQSGGVKIAIEQHSTATTAAAI